MLHSCKSSSRDFGYGSGKKSVEASAYEKSLLNLPRGPRFTLGTGVNKQGSPVRSVDHKQRTKTPDWASVNNEPSLKNKAYHIFGEETPNKHMVNIGQKRTNSVEVVDKILKIWENETKERDNDLYRQVTVKPQSPGACCNPAYISKLSNYSKKATKMKVETGNPASDESIMLDEDSQTSSIKKEAKTNPRESKSQSLHLNKNRGIFFKTQSTSLGGSNHFLRAMILASQNLYYQF